MRHHGAAEALVEAYLSPLSILIADAIEISRLERSAGRGALERAVADGGDIEARSEMMMAALEGALAFTKGLGAVRAMSHAAGRIERLRLHHGTLNAVILPTVIRFNAPHCAQRLARIRQGHGIGRGRARSVTRTPGESGKSIAVQSSQAR